ncbi:MAG: hypothetical protein H6829_04635 [Planctomycetes bacterium]|nr:hypothetical protein [Planctomycetota bacterium]
MEALGEESLESSAAEWTAQLGDPAREALVLLAGGQEGPGLTVGVLERRERLRALALHAVETGLQSAPEAWQRCFDRGLNPNSEAGGRSLEFGLAAMRVAAKLGRIDWADAIAANLASEASLAPTSEALPWRHRFLHREAQSALFQLIGLRFVNREEYEGFPRLPGETQARYRDAFLKAAEREFQLRKQLLDKDGSTAPALLRSSDVRLRELAVQRLIEAVANQSLAVGQVRQELMARLDLEGDARVFHRLLQGLTDLAAAAGEDSEAALELRSHLERLAQTVPSPLAPTLLAALERLPRPGELQATADWRMATGLLLSMFQPELRLDSDTTVQVLRSWSRIHAQASGLTLEGELKGHAEERVLDLMVDPGEPERVRLAAAEALATANIGAESVRRIVSVLQSSSSSNHLRMVCYPLIAEAHKRLPWEALGGEALVEALLRDLQSNDADLSHMAIGLARSSMILDRLVVLERERGTVLPPCMSALEASPSADWRRSLLGLIRDLSQASPRPDLLAAHLSNPSVGEWVQQDPSLAKDLAPIYLALAGPGQSGLIYDAAQSWLRAAPQSTAVGTQSLALVLALPVADALALSGDKHVTLCEQAQAQLVRLPRSESALWASRLAQRWLEVHLPEARKQPGAPHFDHLEALLLAQQVTETHSLALEAFGRALKAHPNVSRERFLIVRDRARFLEPPSEVESDPAGSKGPTARGDWMELVQMLTQLPPEQVRAYQAELDFTDLARAAQVAGSMGHIPQAASLWQARVASVLWRGLSPEGCLRDLEAWAELTLRDPNAQSAQAWLEFVGRTLLPPAGEAVPETSRGPDSAWLRVDGAGSAKLEARSLELRAHCKALPQAVPEAGPQADSPDGPDGEVQPEPNEPQRPGPVEGDSPKSEAKNPEFQAS